MWWWLDKAASPSRCCFRCCFLTRLPRGLQTKVWLANCSNKSGPVLQGIYQRARRSGAFVSGLIGVSADYSGQSEYRIRGVYSTNEVCTAINIDGVAIRSSQPHCIAKGIVLCWVCCFISRAFAIRNSLQVETKHSDLRWRLDYLPTTTTSRPWDINRRSILRKSCWFD
jgi:hypothetical protein